MARLVVRADTWITTPTIIVQPVTGFAMMHLAGFSFTAPWIALSLLLYLLAGACWLPVLWLQWRMARMAQTAATQGGALPMQYWQYARYWEMLGYPAFLAMLVTYYLMVNKPILW